MVTLPKELFFSGQNIYVPNLIKIIQEMGAQFWKQARTNVLMGMQLCKFANSGVMDIELDLCYHMCDLRSKFYFKPLSCNVTSI